MKSLRITFAVLLCVLVVAGCANGDTGRAEPRPDEPAPSEPSESAQPPVVREAIADLARRQGVDPSDVTVVSVEQVTWSDGSLGCAKKGMMYTQALVEGARVILSVDGEVHEYHAGTEGRPFLCERPTQ